MIGRIAYDGENDGGQMAVLAVLGLGVVMPARCETESRDFLHCTVL